MIRKLVDFALNNRYVVLAIGLLVLGWGAVSFHNSPVEVYPEIADNYVQIISQWSGRSAEEMEQQVSVPVEIQMFGIPHLTTVRSESIFGLSLVTLIFDAQSVDDWNRQKVDAGGSFVEEGLQQLNVRALGLYRNVQDIENTVLTTSNGAPVRVKDIAVVEWGPRIRLGHMARADHRPDGVIVDEPDVIKGGVLMRKGAEEGPTIDGIHQKVDELNNHILPEGVKVVPMLDRSDLLHYTLHTVLHNLVEGMLLVTIILFVFLGNARGA